MSKNKQFPAYCTATSVPLPLFPCQPEDSGRQQTGWPVPQAVIAADGDGRQQQERLELLTEIQ